MEKNRMNAEIENFVHNVVWLKNHYKMSKRKTAELLGIGIKR